MLGMIRVITLSDPEAIAMHGELIRTRYNLPVISECIPDQPEGVYDQETEAAAIPKIISLAQALEQRGCRAIGISCAADPGLQEVRAALSIPVISAGSAAAHLALTLADKVGVLTILPDAPPTVKHILGGAYIGADRPEGVRTTLDLQKPGGMQQAVAAARRLQERGAQALALCCTGFVTIGLADVLTKELGIAAVDPILAIGASASQVVASDQAEIG
ncbi:aspartate/glutamate racemase family protein [Brevibacillus humidisoli]|uniref:aspartate/glutamate racemase family protein n=1 Tax=Brevibacillus humidisoli TaxID=2895522 RepID=UPI001E654884|nr:aspartate/glutamate racemase family protein [Brevibacillus humidisoli]UFJ39808.1 aspartate/glutamate racemase family protein [Brevibacillus humidisoli]